MGNPYSKDYDHLGHDDEDYGQSGRSLWDWYEQRLLVEETKALMHKLCREEKIYKHCVTNTMLPLFSHESADHNSPTASIIG